MGTLSAGVQDAFAMVVDDLIEGGHVPVTLQDHIMLQEEDREKILEITGALARLSAENPWKAAGGASYPIIVSGGETAIINTLQGFEMGITATGYVRKGQEITPRAEKGDVLLGLASNGVHSNGLTFFREEFLGRRAMGLGDALPWGATVGQELTRPTNVYLPALKELIESVSSGQRAGEAIHGMVHITGGGLSKLRELIPPAAEVNVEVDSDHSLAPQEIFKHAHREFGVPSEKMYTRFNNGVGYAVVVREADADGALRVLRRHFDADVIGRVVGGSGKVSIRSQYEPVTVTY
jgi:phosphoribosylformylglycinamidine cyclo-ligase